MKNMKHITNDDAQLLSPWCNRLCQQPQPEMSQCLSNADNALQVTALAGKFYPKQPPILCESIVVPGCPTALHDAAISAAFRVMPRLLFTVRISFIANTSKAVM